MGNTYFFSDVHLGMRSDRAEKHREKKLLRFLDHVALYGDRLFIVGDLFDFWFEYRTVIPRGYMGVLSALGQLKELGKELHYIAGNHDFWVRDFLTRELEVQVHFEPLDCTLEGRRFYINHGDGLAKDDKGYRLLKRVFRNRFNIFLYSLLHPDVGIPLAKWVSHFSRHHTAQSGIPDDSDYLALAMEKFQEGFDYAIFGHLHYPILQMYGEKTYVVLGDWIEYFTYALYDGHDLQLLKWK